MGVRLPLPGVKSPEGLRPEDASATPPRDRKRPKKPKGKGILNWAKSK
jgi:hypothetical protein